MVPYLSIVLAESLHRIGMYRHSSIPVILNFLIIKSEVTHATRRSLVDVLQVVTELHLALALVKEFLIVGV
jgi:hypothetical protein